MELLTVENNKVVFASHIPNEGRLIFMAVLRGNNVAKMLSDKFEDKHKKIMEGKKIGTRQTHSISLTAYIKRFGAKELDVIYYHPVKDFNETIKKELNLNSPINLIDNFCEVGHDSNLQLVNSINNNSSIDQWYEI